MPDETLHPEPTPEQPQEAASQETPASGSSEAFSLKHPVPAPAPEPKRTREKDKEKEEASQSPFSVTVGQVYDGPLDLLLDLIRKQNIDIYDIPIARITAQFLDYTHQLQQTDVDSAGEFIYMASLLIHIKSKMLLPRDPSDVTGADPEDPRRELVERLLEHERFKAAAQMLLQKQQIEEATWTNPGMREFKNVVESDREIAADTVDLVRVFREILDRLRQRPVLNVDEESVTVAQMIDYVKRRLVMEEKPVSLRRLLHNTHTERALICMFLAMLELVRLQAVLLHQPVIQGDILIKKTDNFDQVFADQQQARDDWR
jgi:segregation and condensation protein A